MCGALLLMLADNLKILGLLSTTPGWASNLGKPAKGHFDRDFEPLSMDDWANAVRTIVSHHRGLRIADRLARLDLFGNPLPAGTAID
jgi:hypothetical protein